MTQRRKKFFHTREEANGYLKTYEQQFVYDPPKGQVHVFRFKYPVGGRKFFVGSAMEYDLARLSS
jgi:hypothetical protein